MSNKRIIENMNFDDAKKYSVKCTEFNDDFDIICNDIRSIGNNMIAFYVNNLDGSETMLMMIKMDMIEKIELVNDTDDDNDDQDQEIVEEGE